MVINAKACAPAPAVDAGCPPVPASSTAAAAQSLGEQHWCCHQEGMLREHSPVGWEHRHRIGCLCTKKVTLNAEY